VFGSRGRRLSSAPAGAQLVPDVGDGVEAEDVGPPADVEQQDGDDRDQHPRVVVVEVDLVLAEGRPHEAGAVDGLERTQQVRGTRAKDQPQVVRVDGVPGAEGDAEILAGKGKCPREWVSYDELVLAQSKPAKRLDQQTARKRGKGEEGNKAAGNWI